MSLLVPINGQNYIIPTPNEVGWGSNLDDFFTAISNGTLQKTGGSFTLSAETDFGASFGLKSLYLKSRSSNVASTGAIRLANAETGIVWRNALNNADLPLTVNSSNQLTFNGTPIESNALSSAHILVGNASNIATDVAMTGDISIDNTGLTAIGSGKIVNAQINASAAIAYSKLALTGSIVNADIGSSAAIALSKLAALGTAKALQSNASTGLIEASSVTNTELGYVSGVTSAIQTQLDAKMPKSGGTFTNDVTYASSKGIFWTDSGTNTVKITAPTTITPSSYTLKWPVAQGGANQYLTNDGSGNLSWTNAAGTGTVNSGTQYQLGYYATTTNTISGLTLITGSRALASDANGLPVASATTAAELAFVNGVTSAIQTQINTKAPTANPTFTGVVTLANGSVSAPAINFGDAGSGFYRTFLNHVGLTLNGSNVMDWQPLDISFASRLDGPDGSASSCPYTFSSGTQNTGMYKPGANQLGFACNGTQVLLMTSTSLQPAGDTVPQTDNTYGMGNSSHKFSDIWGTNVHVNNTGLSVGGNQAYPIVQVVQGTSTTGTGSTSTTYADTTCTASITPKFNTSKILITASGWASTAGTGNVQLTINRGVTDLGDGTSGFGKVGNGASSFSSIAGLVYYDSPATTSATTYTVRVKTTVAGQSVNFGGGATTSITLTEIAQ